MFCYQIHPKNAASKESNRFIGAGGVTFINYYGFAILLSPESFLALGMVTPTRSIQLSVLLFFIIRSEIGQGG